MDGAKGFSDDYFRAGFFSFLTLLSGSLSLACMLLRRVRALSFASTDWSIRWIDGDMNFSALAGWSPVPPVSFSTKEEKGVERPCSRIIRCASTHAVNQSIIPISTNNKSNRTNRTNNMMDDELYLSSPLLWSYVHSTLLRGLFLSLLSLLCFALR